MAIKKSLFNVKGMLRDAAASKFTPEYAYENQNLRVIATDDNTSYGLTNEKGNVASAITLDGISISSIPGTPVGQEVLNDTLVLFTTGTDGDRLVTINAPGAGTSVAISATGGAPATINYNSGIGDSIFRFNIDDYGGLSGITLFSGSLGFDSGSPIESIGIYENEELQKVYWTDGKNPPRVINIKASDETRYNWNKNSFDFVRKLGLNINVSITKNQISFGRFAPGTLQYCFTYFDLYGAQTNIFYTSPLYYTSYSDRGAAPDDTVSNSFEISIPQGQYDSTFDYLRIYSILRTSVDTTPQVRKVVDIPIKGRTDGITYIDTGVDGETVDPRDLFYVGGELVRVGTMDHKDNTLFMGDITMLREPIESDIKSAARGLNISTTTKLLPLTDLSEVGYYAYDNQLSKNNSQITYYKKGEAYRLGFQAQHYTGKWSEAIFIQDYTVPTGISNTTGGVNLINLTTTITNSTILSGLASKGYVKIRPIVVLPDANNRNIICQGVLNPTVYNAEDRFTDSPFAQASWFFRPNAPYNLSLNNRDINVSDKLPILANGNYPRSYDQFLSAPLNVATKGMWAEFRNNYPIPGNMEQNAEIQCIFYPPNPFLGETRTVGTWTGDMRCDSYYSVPNGVDPLPSITEKTDPEAWVADNKECFYIDQSIITLNSPDVEFDTGLHNLNTSGLKLRIVGYIPFDTSYSDIDIDANAPLNYVKSYSDSTGYEYYPVVAPGFSKVKVSASSSDVGYGWKSLLSGAFWFDELANHKATVPGVYPLPVGFVVYPWHRAGALNNARGADENGYLAGGLLHKKMSITRFSNNSVMLSSPWEAYAPGNSIKKGISDVGRFDSDQVTLIKIKAPENSGLDNIVYYGNIDKVVSFHSTCKDYNLFKIDLDTDFELPQSYDVESESKSYTMAYPAAYPIAAASPVLTDEFKALQTLLISDFPDIENKEYPSVPVNGMNSTWYGIHGSILETFNMRIPTNTQEVFGTPYKMLGMNVVPDSNQYSAHFVLEPSPTCSTDPVSIKYKSSPHLVMALNYTDNNEQRVLPTHQVTINEVGGITSTMSANSATTSWNNSPFWEKGTSLSGASQDTIVLPSEPQTGYLWLGELYRDDIDDNTRFGGTTDEALENNSWIAAGPAVNIVDEDGDALTSATLVWNEGDTYYQRYDCLKTYPFTLDDQNSVVDILSFMCETRVNIDGRYDRNRGKLSNLYTTPVNFNLLNPAYSQTDNFFTYRSVNDNKFKGNIFPNVITWSKTKTMGETVDTWTNVTLASMLEMDGDKGPVRAIRRFNNDLLAFQDKAFSQILYNENVQIATTTGVPIEIANSGKVSGKRYISNHIGCTNKWSICSTPNGIYFIDDIGKDIYLFNGQINNLSDNLGFHSWMVNTFPDIKIWNPRDFATAGEITYYDKINGDVFFITGDTSLCFSEPLRGFSSFYSYGNTPYFANIKDRAIAWHIDNSESSGEYKPWWHREGNYNYYYNVYEPFYTIIIANETPVADKIFNNLEYRGDTFDGETNEYIYNNSFDYLETWNEYQKGTSNLQDIKDVPSTLKKKFRIWRANIPRNNTNKGGDSLHNYTRDRMRNPWLYIKLSKNTPNTYKTVLHDLVVFYFD